MTTPDPNPLPGCRGSGVHLTPRQAQAAHAVLSWFVTHGPFTILDDRAADLLEIHKKLNAATARGKTVQPDSEVNPEARTT